MAAVGCGLVYGAVILLGLDDATLPSDGYYPTVCKVINTHWRNINVLDDAINVIGVNFAYIIHANNLSALSNIQDLVLIAHTLLRQRKNLFRKSNLNYRNAEIYHIH